MKIKGLIQFFAVALILVSIYQLSFNFFTSNIENKAMAFAEKKVLHGKKMEDVISKSNKMTAVVLQDSLNHEIKKVYNQYLDSIGTEDIFLGFNYLTFKKQQL